VKLSRAEEKLRAELVAELAAAGKLVDYRFRELLGKLKAAPEDLNEAIRNYNILLVKARVMTEALAETFRDSYEEKSDRWQESEAGQNAEAFCSEWESFEPTPIPEVALLEPELEEKPCHAEELDSLPNQSE
jgi:hypothetical protein